MTGPADDPYDLERFVAAQSDIYDRALAEIRAGEKRSHWMWFVFPQIAGLGSSAMARHYALRSLAEARAYLIHPVLGPRYRDCVAAVLVSDIHDAEHAFGSIDTIKLRSSLTLFEAADGPDDIGEVLDRLYDGQRDTATLTIIEEALSDF